MRAEGKAGRPGSERTGRTPGRAPATVPADAPGAQPPGLLALQGSAGNAAVVQMLRHAGHPGAQAAEQERHQHGAGCGHQQAERPAVQRAAGPQVQRSAVHDVLRSGGRPLDDSTRSDMESRLGADFSDVRIHNDSAAKASAAEVGARAYTSGSHVVIGDGGADKHTLAHELTHVIQQRQGPVAGTDNGSGLKVSDPSDRFEREAEANASRVMSGPAPESQVAAQRSVADGPVTAQRALATPSSAPAVQRRGGNPYAKPVDQDGWTTTAHHIVAHSTLTGALGKLTDEERMKVLTAAVPKVITAATLTNLRVLVPENENTAAYRRALQKRLADPANADSESERGISFGDIRHSFFEWQAGNQFVGPNTSIRAEPSANGDDIDTDGKYFNGMDPKEFGQLTGLGDKLKNPALGNDDIVKTLTGILRLTKDRSVADFDPAKWTEVDNGQTVDELAADLKVNRAHITGYTFFKIPAAAIRAGRYHDLKPAEIGGGYEYYGKPLAGAQARGEWVYIPYLTDEAPPAKEGKGARPRQTLRQFCETQNVPTSTYLPKGMYNPHRGR
ncbi:DUF4157 domain-containing protein [Streptomyces sp. NBC_00083]|uniref:eCIS core domain-containing protein n=1 Tax=Streptomyces sp. NBC_00083 TaxID=2975647 RepID=UPI00224F633F|nr:DUF4157 domain-containing protein [Streptomyces sp. NBC_00083]MCX5381829.1 DUF4157 domain-containing protein [Streptomyces sp. NBC_00083]